MRFSDRTARIVSGGAEAWEVHFEAGRLRSAGRDIILLTIGDPDQSPPAVVIDATIDALKRHRTGYSPIAGLPSVREAIAARILRRTSVACRDQNVIVVPGAQAGLFCAVQCIAGPGDEIIVPEPMYATYSGVIGASGADVVNVPLSPDRGFHPDTAAIANTITSRTRAIWINSPHNPTGAVLTAAELNHVGALCRKHDLWLLSDEVYEDLAFDRPHISAWSLRDISDRVIVVSSLSKSHAIPGFRFGWIAGPEPLIQHLINLVLSMLYGAPPFIQEGALSALTDDLPTVVALHEDYRRRAALLSGLLAKTPNCVVHRPEGGMFVLLDVRRTGLSSTQFAHALLAEEGVAVLPCDTFGPSGRGQLRISLTVSDIQLEEAGRRIERFAARLASSVR